MKSLTANDIQVITTGAFVDDLYEGKWLVRTFTFRTISPDVHNEFYWNDFVLNITYNPNYLTDGKPYGYTIDEWRALNNDRFARAQRIHKDLKKLFEIAETEGFNLTRSCSEIYTVVATARLTPQDGKNK